MHGVGFLDDRSASNKADPSHHTYQNTRLSGGIEIGLSGHQQEGAACHGYQWKRAQAGAAVMLKALPAGGQPQCVGEQNLASDRYQAGALQSSKSHVWYSDVLVMKITSVRAQKSADAAISHQPVCGEGAILGLI